MLLLQTHNYTLYMCHAALHLVAMSCSMIGIFLLLSPQQELERLQQATHQCKQFLCHHYLREGRTD